MPRRAKAAPIATRANCSALPMFCLRRALTISSVAGRGSATPTRFDRPPAPSCWHRGAVPNRAADSPHPGGHHDRSRTWRWPRMSSASSVGVAGHTTPPVYIGGWLSDWGPRHPASVDERQDQGGAQHSELGRSLPCGSPSVSGPCARCRPWWPSALAIPNGSTWMVAWRGGRRLDATCTVQAGRLSNSDYRVGWRRARCSDRQRTRHGNEQKTTSRPSWTTMWGQSAGTGMPHTGSRRPLGSLVSCRYPISGRHR